MHITAIFADTFDSGLDLCPGCKIKRAEGRVQKRPFTSWIIENKKKKPAETLLSNLRKLLSPSSPRKDVIILFSKVRSVYRNKHLSENRHEMLESQQRNLDSMWSEPAHRYQQLVPSHCLKFKHLLSWMLSSYACFLTVYLGLPVCWQRHLHVLVGKLNVTWN